MRSHLSRDDLYTSRYQLLENLDHIL
jgi:hypothetical protein